MNPVHPNHRQRRQRLLAAMQAAGGGLAFLATAGEVTRNRDTHHPYRADSYFHYLTGFSEPEAALVLLASDSEQKAILFCRPRDEAMEIWTGVRHGPQAARERFGFDEAWPIDRLDEKLAGWLPGRPALWHAFGRDAGWDGRIARALQAVRAQSRSGRLAPTVMHDLHAVLDEMRLVKDEHEIALMRRAAEVSALAHRRAMRATRPGRYEYEIEAELLYEFRRHGCSAPAYPCIVASGENACILHYPAGERRLQAGELLLIDAGGEYQGYAGDITRTLPVSGRYEGAAAEIYRLVLAAQQAAIAAVQPAASCDAPHEAAQRVLAQGFVDLGLLHGSVDGILEAGSWKRFFMHRTSHWLGMDVHDAGEYRLAGGKAGRPLEPGMMLTVEPGCYIRPAGDVPQAFWHIGVRIEDDVLVTAEGHEVLTTQAPSAMAEVEAAMREENGNV